MSQLATMLLSPKRLPRLTAIVGLFTRFGLRDVAKQQGLLSLVAHEEEELSDEELHDREANAVGFRKRLIELGPAYIKLGQLLSTRPDLLPEQYIRELESLQDDVGPIPLEDVERTIEEELSGRLSKLFDEFDPEPLGTASLGQVHAAKLRGGRDVVVKVQRPHIRAALADELDYRIEARSAAAFRRSLSQFPRLVVPKVIEAYSSEKVLTTERVRGVKADDISPIARLELPPRHRWRRWKWRRRSPPPRFLPTWT